jgi:hypothetical protein
MDCDVHQNKMVYNVAQWYADAVSDTTMMIVVQMLIKN